MNIKVQFLPDNITTEAAPGEPLLQVAQRAGVFIPTGCLMGTCHACEVELDNATAICACISSIPSGKEFITIHLYSDPVW